MRCRLRSGNSRAAAVVGRVFRASCCSPARQQEYRARDAGGVGHGPRGCYKDGEDGHQFAHDLVREVIGQISTPPGARIATSPRAWKRRLGLLGLEGRGDGCMDRHCPYIKSPLGGHPTRGLCSSPMDLLSSECRSLCARVHDAVLKTRAAAPSFPARSRRALCADISKFTRTRCQWRDRSLSWWTLPAWSRSSSPTWLVSTYGSMRARRADGST